MYMCVSFVFSLCQFCLCISVSLCVHMFIRRHICIYEAQILASYDKQIHVLHEEKKQQQQFVVK